MNTTGTKKRTYYDQFKRDAVALLEGGARPPSSPVNWAFPTGTSAIGSNAAVEIPPLRRELDSIRTQNDILKKAVLRGF